MTEKQFFAKRRRTPRLNCCWEKLIIWQKTDAAKKFFEDLKTIKY